VVTEQGVPDGSDRQGVPDSLVAPVVDVIEPSASAFAVTPLTVSASYLSSLAGASD